MRFVRSIAIWSAACVGLGIAAFAVGAGAGLLFAWLTGPAGMSGLGALSVLAFIGLALAGAAGGIAAEASRR